MTSQPLLRRSIQLASALLIASSALAVPMFSTTAEAVIGSPPTCYPNPRRCIRCVEREMLPVGGSRCVKCVRDFNCRIRFPYRTR